MRLLLVFDRGCRKPRAKAVDEFQTSQDSGNCT